jgi:hypothetical protein
VLPSFPRPSSILAAADSAAISNSRAFSYLSEGHLSLISNVLEEILNVLIVWEFGVRLRRVLRAPWRDCVRTVATQVLVQRELIDSGHQGCCNVHGPVRDNERRDTASA